MIQFGDTLRPRPRTIIRSSMLSLTAVAGIAGVTFMVFHYGLRGLVRTLELVGWWGFLTVVLMQLAIAMGCSIAWRALLPVAKRPSIWPFILGRMVRNAVSETLFLPNVGGFVAGARSATSAGVSGIAAMSSTVADLTVELAAQIAYVTLGFVIFVAYHPMNKVAYLVAAALIIGAAVGTGFVSVQVHGLGIMRVLTSKLQLAGMAENAVVLCDSINEIYSHQMGIVRGFALHFFCWIAGAVQVWFALKLMHANVGIGTAISMESFLCAVRALAFVMPAAIGIQEGSYVVLAGIFGIVPGFLLALSLLKRARDSVLGIWPLFAWHIIENRQLLI